MLRLRCVARTIQPSLLHDSELRMLRLRRRGYLQEAGVGPDGQVELGGVGDQQNVAVHVGGGPQRAELQGEDVQGPLGGDEDGVREVQHLEAQRGGQEQASNDAIDK